MDQMLSTTNAKYLIIHFTLGYLITNHYFIAIIFFFYDNDCAPHYHHPEQATNKQNQYQTSSTRIETQFFFV